MRLSCLIGRFFLLFNLASLAQLLLLMLLLHSTHGLICLLSRVNFLWKCCYSILTIDTDDPSISLCCIILFPVSLPVHLLSFSFHPRVTFVLRESEEASSSARNNVNQTTRHNCLAKLTLFFLLLLFSSLSLSRSKRNTIELRCP